MNVENVLKNKNPEVYTIHVDAVVCDALKIMNEKRIGALMVLDDEEQVAGILTERDITRSCFHTQANVKSLGVKDIMTGKKDLVVARAEDNIEQLMVLMTEKRIRHIPIVDSHGKLVGMVSIGDVVKALITDKDHQISHLKDYIENKYPL